MNDKITDAMVQAALGPLPADHEGRDDWQVGFNSAMQIVREELPSALEAAFAAAPKTEAQAAGDGVLTLIEQLRAELAADKGWDYTEYEKGRIAEKERMLSLLAALPTPASHDAQHVKTAGALAGEGGAAFTPFPCHAGDKCFACGKVIGRLEQEWKADTRDGQFVFVGSECYRKIKRAGEDGWQPPKGGPRLWLCGTPAQQPAVVGDEKAEEAFASLSKYAHPAYEFGPEDVVVSMFMAKAALRELANTLTPAVK